VDRGEPGRGVRPASGVGARPVGPGSEAQIECGRLGLWTDLANGTRHTIQAFVMVLAGFRLIFVARTFGWTKPHGVKVMPSVRILS
jgi:hypothetical protein